MLIFGSAVALAATVFLVNRFWRDPRIALGLGGLSACAFASAPDVQLGDVQLGDVPLGDVPLGGVQLGVSASAMAVVLVLYLTTAGSPSIRVLPGDLAALAWVAVALYGELVVRGGGPARGVYLFSVLGVPYLTGRWAFGSVSDMHRCRRWILVTTIAAVALSIGMAAMSNVVMETGEIDTGEIDTSLNSTSDFERGWPATVPPAIIPILVAIWPVAATSWCRNRTVIPTRPVLIGGLVLTMIGVIVWPWLAVAVLVSLAVYAAILLPRIRVGLVVGAIVVVAAVTVNRGRIGDELASAARPDRVIERLLWPVRSSGDEFRKLWPEIRRSGWLAGKSSDVPDPGGVPEPVEASVGASTAPATPDNTYLAVALRDGLAGLAMLIALSVSPWWLWRREDDDDLHWHALSFAIASTTFAAVLCLRHDPSSVTVVWLWMIGLAHGLVDPVVYRQAR